MRIGPFTFMHVREADQIRGDAQMLRRTIEDLGWVRIGSDQGDARALLGVDLYELMRRCKKAWIVNPLVGHAVHLTTAFVFGQGVTEPKAQDDRVQKVISDFWQDPDNRISLTSPAAQAGLSNKLQYEGNLFLALFVNRQTGQVKVRPLDPQTISEIIRLPNDNMRTSFFKQSMAGGQFNFVTGAYSPSTDPTKFRYIPSYDLGDPDSFGIPEVRKAWDNENYACVMHVRVNTDPLDKWGIPEVYRSIDWVNAHRDMAGDMATVIRSQAMYMWQKKVKGTSGQINALKSALQMTSGQSVPKPAAGSTHMSNPAVEFEPIDTPTGAAQIHEIGLRQMRLIVAASFGIFEHYFGDAGNANLASTKAMELPMLKLFQSRQQFWTGVLDELMQFVVNQAVMAGMLPGTADVNPSDNRWVIETPVDRAIDIDFPPILDEDLMALATAMTTAKEGRLVSEETAAKQFMIGAGINNIEEELERIEEDKAEAQDVAAAIADEDPDPADPKTPAGRPQTTEGALRRMLKEAEAKSGAGHAEGVRAVMDKVRRMRRGTAAYERSLVASFRKFVVSVPGRVRVSGPDGMRRAAMPDMHAAVDRFLEDMQKSARQFFPEAVRAGTAYVYGRLRRGVDQVRAREADHDAYLDDRLAWNARYISESLGLDMRRAIEKALMGEFPDEPAARAAVQKAIREFEPRVRQYAGAYWTVEEKAVKEFGKDFDLMVNFIGPDDDGTCPDCEEAVNGGPYPIGDAPVPGEDTVCRGNCRHALQIVGQEPVGV